MKKPAVLGALAALIVLSMALFTNGCGKSAPQFTVHTSTSAT